MNTSDATKYNTQPDGVVLSTKTPQGQVRTGQQPTNVAGGAEPHTTVHSIGARRQTRADIEARNAAINLNIQPKPANDFGFTTSEQPEDITEDITTQKTPLEIMQERAENAEKLFVEWKRKYNFIHDILAKLLTNLAKNSENPWIKWPNRDKAIQKIQDDIIKNLEE